MVNPWRVVCIITPFLLSLAALVCVVLIFLAGTIQRDSTVDDFYFVKLDLTNFTLTSSANLATSANLSPLTGALEAAKQSLGMADYYTVYLRNYCQWNGNDLYANCTSPTSDFWFNPISIWNLNSTGTNLDDVLPATFRDGLNTYHYVSTAIFILYSTSLALTAITLLVGIAAFFSRWGSLFTTIFSSCATTILLLSSILASIAFPILTTALNKTLRTDYGIATSTGGHFLALTWIGVAFSLGAGFFWLFTICCCAGHRHNPYQPHGMYGQDGRRGRGTQAIKTPYTYERVGSPYLGPRDTQAVPLQTFMPQQGAQNTGYRETAYEPFRPQGQY